MTTTQDAIPAQAPAPVRELDHGARTIAALETAWAAIRRQQPDVPRAVVITGGMRQHGGARLGHFGVGLWAVPEQAQSGADEQQAGRQRTHELFVAGELLGKGGREVVAVMLHEAAHGIATTRGVNDTSGDGNRYHNREFVRFAEELGLKGPTERVPTHGWAFCTMPDETAARYAEVIAAIDSAALPYLEDHLTIGMGGAGGPETGDDAPQGNTAQQKAKKGTGAAGRRFPVQCACDPPRRTQVTPKFWKDGGILCAVCHHPFTAVNAADLPDEDDEE